MYMYVCIKQTFAYLYFNGEMILLTWHITI